VHHVGHLENKYVANVFLNEAQLGTWVSYTEQREIKLKLPSEVIYKYVEIV
jgi:hypothetical protein